MGGLVGPGPYLSSLYGGGGGTLLLISPKISSEDPADTPVVNIRSIDCIECNYHIVISLSSLGFIYKKKKSRQSCD